MGIFKIAGSKFSLLEFDMVSVRYEGVPPIFEEPRVYRPQSFAPVLTGLARPPDGHVVASSASTFVKRNMNPASSQGARA